MNHCCQGNAALLADHLVIFLSSLTPTTRTAVVYELVVSMPQYDLEPLSLPLGSGREGAYDKELPCNPFTGKCESELSY